jgi:hypothetical protein
MKSPFLFIILSNTWHSQYMNAISKYGPAYIVLSDPRINSIYKLQDKILYAKCNETYESLGKKIAIALFWSSQQNVETFDFLVKIDTDTVFCYHSAYMALLDSQHLQHKLVYAGVFNEGYIPYTSGKWKDFQFNKTFGKNMYSKYAYGGGYVLSKLLLEQVVTVVRKYKFESFDGILEDALVGHLVSIVDLHTTVYYKKIDAITTAEVIHRPRRCQTRFIFQHKVFFPARYMP